MKPALFCYCDRASLEDSRALFGEWD